MVKRVLALFTMTLAFALALSLGPRSLLAEELTVISLVNDAPQQAADPAPADQKPVESDADKKAEDEKKEEEPPKRTFVVNYDANGGTGSMPASTFTEGEAARISRCSFTRSGYTFEGWSTAPDGSGTHVADGTDIAPLLTADTLTLYAQWGSQIYLIRYSSGVTAGNGSPATGDMPTQLAVHDAEVSLMPCGFSRKGYQPKGWLDSSGTFREFESSGINFVEGTSTASWELANVSIKQARPDASGPWSCQGTVVFDGGDGNTYAAVCFIYYDTAYAQGSLENYDSEICVFNLETGELVKHASHLMLEHANDIAYRPDNGHFYVAQGGLRDGYPNGIVELDKNLKEVRTVTPEGTHHIWNLTYADGVFYAIGNVNGDSFARGNPTGDTSDLIKLDKDLKVVDQHAIDFSSQGFSGQGMACDGDNLYAILINFAEHEAKQKQRLNIFTLDGEPRGSQRIDINYEVESASWLNNRMYFTINGGMGCTIYGTDLASTTMTCVWQPNTYEVAFDANGVQGAAVPETFQMQYDVEANIPAEVVECPGYEFVGWNAEPDGSGRWFEPGEPVINLAESGVVTMYAQWRRPSVSLVGDNGKSVRGKRYRNAQAGKQRREKAGLPAPKPRHAASFEGALLALFGALVFVLVDAALAFGVLHNTALTQKGRTPLGRLPECRFPRTVLQLVRV